MTRVGGIGVAVAITGVLATFIGLSGRHPLFAQQPQALGAVGGLEVLQLRPNFYMIAGAGGNIGVQTGPDGMVVVDTGSADKADAVVAAISQLAHRPIR